VKVSSLARVVSEDGFYGTELRRSSRMARAPGERRFSRALWQGDCIHDFVEKLSTTQNDPIVHAIASCVDKFAARRQAPHDTPRKFLLVYFRVNFRVKTKGPTLRH